MKKAYLEANAISRAVENEISGEALREKLQSKGYLAVIGFHTIYELAKIFLNAEKTEIGKSLFIVVKNLGAMYSEESKEILRQEYKNCINKEFIKPFISDGKLTYTNSEIDKLACGVFDSRARVFIQNREHSFRSDHIIMSANNIRAFKENPPQDRLCTFEDVTSYYRDSFPMLVKKILNDVPTESVAHQIAGTLDSYPAIRSAVMANMYLVFVESVQKVVPATDKVDDHRHLIEASYCDVFITQEKQLLNNVQKINPELRAISWSDLVGLTYTAADIPKAD